MQPSLITSHSSLHVTDTKPEPTPAMKNEPETEKWAEASIALEPEPHCKCDQVCEPVLTSMPAEVLAELNSDDWLIDWEKEVELPILPATIGSIFQTFASPWLPSRASTLPPQLDFYGVRKEDGV
ncbi:hypothetical protein M9458_028757, partial [Cirrhinus mrigala]